MIELVWHSLQAWLRAGLQQYLLYFALRSKGTVRAGDQEKDLAAVKASRGGCVQVRLLVWHSAAGCVPTQLPRWSWCATMSLVLTCLVCTANLAQFDQPVELPIGAELTRNKGAKGGSWAGGPQLTCCGMFPAAPWHSRSLACPQLVGGHLPRPTGRLPQPCVAVVIELQSGGLFGGDTIGTVQVRSPRLNYLHNRMSQAPLFRSQLHLLLLPLLPSLRPLPLPSRYRWAT